MVLLVSKEGSGRPDPHRHKVSERSLKLTIVGEGGRDKSASTLRNLLLEHCTPEPDSQGAEKSEVAQCCKWKPSDLSGEGASLFQSPKQVRRQRELLQV